MVTAPAELTPIRGVIFDFHATLVDADRRDPGGWLQAAVRHLGWPENASAEPGLAGLPDHLDRLWEHAHTIDPDSERDLDAARHRAIFLRTVDLYPGVAPDLAEALYAVMAEQWTAYADTVPVLRELRARGVRSVVLSNIGLDIRDHLDQIGVGELIDGVVLSYQVGVVKPHPEIFARALTLLDLPASETLMVGDSWRHDAGAAALGMRTLILPRTVGPIHGLAAVLRLVG